MPGIQHETKHVNTATTSFKPSAFLHPRHWAAWLAVGLLRMVAAMPYGVQLFIGRRFGDLMFGLLPRKTQTTTRKLPVGGYNGDRNCVFLVGKRDKTTKPVPHGRRGTSAKCTAAG